MFVFRVVFIFFSLVHFSLYGGSSVCSAETYHTLKNEVNLDKVGYKIIDKYSAEIFTMYHIYSIDKERDVGEEFQFGKNHVAKLIKYKQYLKSGFEAGLYEIDGSKLIVAFGGTMSQEKYSKSSMWKDILADAELLSNKVVSDQIKETATFIQSVQVDYPKRNIVAVGHSLGGGLAQFASLMSKEYGDYKKIKAVTLNTAPMPLTKLTKKWVEKYDYSTKWADENNINFMVNNDPLTSILKSVEAYKGDFLLTFKIDTGISSVNTYLNNTTKGIILKQHLFAALEILMNTKLNKLNKLIYGKRYILPINTGHSMNPFMKKVYPALKKFGTFRDGFSDVNVASFGLYCQILKLMEVHVISYPKEERDYKFEPKNYASFYEVSIFIVNAFYYKEYREALLKEPSLTKYKYYVDHFGINLHVKNTEDEPLSSLKENLRKVYNEKFEAIDSSLKFDVIERCGKRAEDLVFWGEKDFYFTRSQMVSFIVQSIGINYLKILKDVKDKIKQEKKLKTGPKFRFNPIKSFYYSSPVHLLVPKFPKRKN